jgi:hypothetical protein
MPTPAYLDVSQQAFTEAQQFQKGVTIIATADTPGIELPGDFSVEPIIFRLIDGGSGGRIEVLGPDSVLDADHFQHFLPLDGFLAVSQVRGAHSPSVETNAANDPPASEHLGCVSRTAQAAAIAVTNLTAATPPGLHEITYYASTTTANALDGTIGLRLAYTDRVGATTQSAVGTLSLAATSTGTTALKGVMVVYLASGNITYEAILTGAQTTSRYALEVRCKYLG